jgi:UDP-glucose 4-epimerase
VGQAIADATRGDFPAGRIPWTDPRARQEVLTRAAENFLDEVEHEPWCVVWAAGSGTVGTEKKILEGETRAVQEFAEMFSTLLSHRSAPRAPGLCVLVSSAGGVYAGTPNPPYSKVSSPEPISDYGHAKLAQEELWKGCLGEVSSTLIARISNVYGEAQRIEKRQGLISQLAYSAATRQPLQIYVPLDTVRDYIHAEDAARLITGHIADHCQSTTRSINTNTVIVASGEGTSVATLIGMMTNVCHRKIPIAAAANEKARRQARDSRFVPDLPAGFVDSGARTLPLGLQQVYQGIIRQLQERGAATRVVGQ